MKRNRYGYVVICVLLAAIVAIARFILPKDTASPAPPPTTTTATARRTTEIPTTPAPHSTAVTAPSTITTTETPTTIVTTSLTTSTTTRPTTPHNIASKPATSKTTKTTKTTTTTTGKKSYLDTSQLTGTQEDVGKVVGYNSMLKMDIVVVSIKEEVNGSGLRGIVATLSDYTAVCLKMECRYCWGYPCPDGGGEACSKYDIKKDGRYTCQRCKRPLGDGYNGTCDLHIDWNNGGKLICNHYD